MKNILIIFSFVLITFQPIPCSAAEIKASSGDTIIATSGGLESTPMLVFDPEPGVTNLRFIRQTDSGSEIITSINFNEPFSIEATFDTPPEETTKTVILNWGEGADKIKKIIVRQQADNQEQYISDSIYLKKSAAPEEN